MKILVTGAAGRLGSVVCRRLHDAGHEVRATDRTRDPSLPVPVIVADLTMREVAYPLVEGMEGIIHLGNIPDAHRTDAQTTYTVNTAANIHLFQAAAESGVRRIVFASSVQAVSGTRTLADDVPSVLPHLPLDGAIPACPGNTYGLSKQAGEDALAFYARTHQLHAVALRFPWLISRARIEHIFQRGNGTSVDPDKAAYSRPDEGLSFLAFDDAAALAEAALLRAPAGYRCFMPAHPRGRLHGLRPGEIARRYFPGVPHKRDLDALGSLFHLDEIEQVLGWRPGNPE
ncbi:MAG: NAD(P)-dependent oxidoreductase [Opitutales bacterium]|nr:NAD(P)-dependent oxidoreductase [Opitutales bacterium]